MRPGDFSPGNHPRLARDRPGDRASMRPGDFSPGNRSRWCRPGSARWSRFNEAGGFLPRKPCIGSKAYGAAGTSFNEAGGFLPRKRVPRSPPANLRHRASMRPGDFSPGNTTPPEDPAVGDNPASMRPGDFSPGNWAADTSSEVTQGSFNEAGGFLPRKLRRGRCKQGWWKKLQGLQAFVWTRWSRPTPAG